MRITAVLGSLWIFISVKGMRYEKMMIRELIRDSKKGELTDKSYKNALHEALFIAQVIDKEQELRNIVIGVSFGVKSNARGTTWNPGNIDFIFRIKDRNSWAIGIFKQELRDMITTIEGNTDFPTLYKCNKE